MELNPGGQIKHNEQISDSTLLSNIESIRDSSSMPKTREDLARYVEASLLEACQILYDKNIRTYMSSANERNIRVGFATISIYFDSLLKENKEIGLGLGELYTTGGLTQSNCISLHFPVNQ